MNIDTKILMVSELPTKWYRLTMSLKNSNAHNSSIGIILRRLERTINNHLTGLYVNKSSYLPGTSEFFIEKLTVVLIQNKQPQLHIKYEQIDSCIRLSGCLHLVQVSLRSKQTQPVTFIELAATIGNEIK